VDRGTAEITASLKGVTGTTDLTVSDARLLSITVAPSGRTIAKGTTIQFTATGKYSDQSTQELTAQVVWSSDDETVASPSNAGGEEGLTTGTGKGQAMISASRDGVTGSVGLTVSDATLASIAVEPQGAKLAKGTRQQFTATGTYTDMSTQDITSQVTWSSSDITVIAVSNSEGSEGLGSSGGKGTVTITATLSGKSGSAMATVTDAVLVSVTVSPVNPTVARGATLQFQAVGKYSDNSTQNVTKQVTWVSSDLDVATISNAGGSEGRATGVGAGQATITATLMEISDGTILNVQ
jgi:hypothetical protein